MAHWNYKHGGSSSLARALPKHLRKTFLEVSERKDIITLRDEIALLETRMIDLLHQLEEGGSSDFWQRARKCADAVRAGDGNPLDLAELVNQGAEQWSVWEDILNTIETRRRLSDTERKRLEMLGAYMTEAEAAALAGQLVRIVGEVVSDRRQLSEVVSRLEAIMSSKSPQNQNETYIDAEEIEEIMDNRALVRVEKMS